MGNNDTLKASRRLHESPRAKWVTTVRGMVRTVEHWGAPAGVADALAALAAAMGEAPLRDVPAALDRVGAAIARWGVETPRYDASRMARVLIGELDRMARAVARARAQGVE